MTAGTWTFPDGARTRMLNGTFDFDTDSSVTVTPSPAPWIFPPAVPRYVSEGVQPRSFWKN